jgi:hypothetical protein
LVNSRGLVTGDYHFERSEKFKKYAGKLKFDFAISVAAFRIRSDPYVVLGLQDPDPFLRIWITPPTSKKNLEKP